MPRVKLLHNAKAGDENHSQAKLISMIESKGYTCDYSDIKAEKWEIPHETDLIVVAGGDGTVKRLAKKLLERRLVDKRFPIAILPLGTANNLSAALNLESDAATAIAGWSKAKPAAFDVGRIYGLQKYDFFLEGIGYGLFPYLIHKMKTADAELADDPEARLKTALKKLQKIIETYKPHFAHVVIDGQDLSGQYLMIEVLNIPSIGPNLHLAPEANTGDGYFDVVLVTDSDRKVLVNYIENRLKGKETPLKLNPLRGKQIYLKWKGTDGHVDDKLIRSKDHPELKIENHAGLLEFLK